jgi:hypothetical protein
MVSAPSQHLYPAMSTRQIAAATKREVPGQDTIRDAPRSAGGDSALLYYLILIYVTSSYFVCCLSGSARPTFSAAVITSKAHTKRRENVGRARPF